MTNFFKVANALIGYRENVECLFRMTNLCTTNNHFSYESIGRAELEYVCNIKNDFRRGHNNTLQFNLPTTDPGIITNINFTYRDVLSKAQSDIPRAVLEYVVKNCPRMEIFTLENISPFSSQIILSTLKEKPNNRLYDQDNIKENYLILINTE